jgi:hypothetical protein
MKTKKKIISAHDTKILFSDKTPMGTFWNNCKSDNRCEKPPYNKLLENKILGNDYAKYVENKFLKRTQEEKVDELYEIMKTKKKIITAHDKEILFSDGTLVGMFWNDCKSDNRCEKSPYNKLLQNQILKKDYAKFLKNKGVTRLTQEEKVGELLEIMKDRTKIITLRDKEIRFSDDILVGSFWNDCKKDNRCVKPPYDKLLENLILKDDYAKKKRNYIKKKDVNPLLVPKT